MSASLTVKLREEVRKAVDMRLDQGFYQVVVVDEKSCILAIMN